MDQHFQSGSRRIAGVCITAPLRPTLFPRWRRRRRKRSIVHCLAHATRSYSPPSSCSTARALRLTSSWDVIEEDPSVLRIAASLAADRSVKQQNLSDSVMTRMSLSQTWRSVTLNQIQSHIDNGTALTSTVCC